MRIYSLLAGTANLNLLIKSDNIPSSSSASTYPSRPSSAIYLEEARNEYSTGKEGRTGS